MFVQAFTAIHPIIVERFQSGQDKVTFPSQEPKTNRQYQIVLTMGVHCVGHVFFVFLQRCHCLPDKSLLIRGNGSGNWSCVQVDHIKWNYHPLWFCNCIINVKRKSSYWDKMSFPFSDWWHDGVTHWARSPLPFSRPISVNYSLPRGESVVANTSNKITLIEQGYIYAPLRHI